MYYVLASFLMSKCSIILLMTILPPNLRTSIASFLLSNAVKFTNRGKITVSVRVLSEDENSVTLGFSITDTGIGIIENKIAGIFENFQQASSDTSRIYGGTGLGLAIAKQLVEAQGGSIAVESKIDEGSTFSFILNFPKTDADTEVESDLMEEEMELHNLKVLVVEDMALNQLLMRTLLDDFGFDCDIADNGLIAVNKLKANPYDIVLMDLQMPEMNGFEATDYIRNTLNSEIPIIALTADVTTVDLEKCKFVGMNDYIAKPVDERVLYSKIVSLVKKHSLAMEDKEELTVKSKKKKKCTDLEYLTRRTKSNPVLMKEMISLYLEQTPPLISAMKLGLKEKDWDSLYAAVHKMIPSFSIMGIHEDFENMARKVQDYASYQIQLDARMTERKGIPELVEKLETVCEQACIELKQEFNSINNHINE